MVKWRGLPDIPHPPTSGTRWLLLSYCFIVVYCAISMSCSSNVNAHRYGKVKARLNLS